MAESTLGSPSVVAETLREPRFKGAYDIMLPDIMKVQREDFAQMAVDVPAVVTMTLGAASGIEKLRAQCEKELPGVGLAPFDEIETLALALGYAHSRHRAAALPALPVQELSERVIAVRDTLMGDWAPYARRGWMDGERIRNLKGPIGYKNQAFDVLTLVAMGRDAWPRIEGKTAITAVELDEAEMLADQLLTAVGERNQLPARSAPSAAIRRAAFTLFARAYDELRRLAIYLRWHDRDADAFVPPLTGGRKRRGGETAEELEEGSVIPHAPAVQAPAEPEPTKSGSNVAVGMPGSDPFASA